MTKTLSRLLAVALAAALMVTCAISGLVLPVAAEGETPEVNTEPTFGVNLFTNKSITKTIAAGTAGDKGQYYAMDEFMLEGYRYVMRWEAKGPATSVSPNPGKWSQNITTKDSTEWITYQSAFVAGTMNTEIARLWVSITMSNTAATEYGDFQMRNVQLLYAPADGRFNLVPDSGFDNAGGFSLFQDQLDDGGAQLVKDPFGSDNQVIQLISSAGGTSYNNLPEEEKKKLKGLPVCLEDALDALEADHDYLTAGGVFPEELIANFIKNKRAECSQMSAIPHPAEFDKYYNL